MQVNLLKVRVLLHIWNCFECISQRTVLQSHRYIPRMHSSKCMPILYIFGPRPQHNPADQDDELRSKQFYDRTFTSIEPTRRQRHCATVSMCRCAARGAEELLETHKDASTSSRVTNPRVHSISLWPTTVHRLRITCCCMLYAAMATWHHSQCTSMWPGCSGCKHHQIETIVMRRVTGQT